MGAENVLLVGDSISLAYQYRAQLVAGDRHTIIHSMTNASTSGYCKNKIGEWLNVTNLEWDVVHFNVGLHDLSRPEGTNFPPKVLIEEYQDNLLSIVDIIKSHSPDAIIAFSLTTPVTTNALPGRIPDDVPKYNVAALNVLRGTGVLINDLYSPLVPHLDTMYNPDGTHPTWEGNQLNAKNVVAFLDAVTAPSNRAYADWADSFGLTGADAAESVDVDHDGYDNLFEFSCGGNPTNSADVGDRPHIYTASNQTFFTVNTRMESGSCFYLVELCNDLTEGNWTHTGYETVSLKAEDDRLTLINRFDAGFSNTFVRITASTVPFFSE